MRCGSLKPWVVSDQMNRVNDVYNSEVTELVKPIFEFVPPTLFRKNSPKRKKSLDDAENSYIMSKVLTNS
jgi:hypothetical protein